MCKFIPVKYEIARIHPFFGGLSLWNTEWLIIIYSLGVVDQEDRTTKSLLFAGGQVTKM